MFRQLFDQGGARAAPRPRNPRVGAKRRGALGVAALALTAMVAAGAARLRAHPDAHDGASPPLSLVNGAAPEPGTAAACARGLKLCGAECVSVDRPETGCGDDGCYPCRATNGSARCDARHRCELAHCYPGFDDCDGDRGNGCETDLRIDPRHCGQCGSRCPAVPHAEIGCGGGCTIWRCESGFRDCNGAVSDGCETGVLDDPANCGGCGRTCRGQRPCRLGRCW
jgi:hypothetical protein